MARIDDHLDVLAAAELWRYGPAERSAAEPAAWTSLALAAHGRRSAAMKPASWLASIQQESGAVGVTADLPEPSWPTSLALLVWCTLNRMGESGAFSANVERASSWSLAARGRTAPRSVHVGHDTELTGWSWAPDTHSWLEPTCMFVLGLRAAGFRDHPRVREGVNLITDRLLPEGGANYGNTIVLGQPLVPHVQPTGLAMLTLAGEDTSDPRVAKSLRYLERQVHAELSPTSLAMACMGLAAHGRRPAGCSDWLTGALNRSRAIELSDHQRALLVLAFADVAQWMPIQK